MPEEVPELGRAHGDDRTLLPRSAGGLALLASFLNDERSVSCGQLILYASGVGAFSESIVALLAVFSRNAKVLGKQGTPVPTNDLWTAALAVQHGLNLFARDPHFDHLPQIPRA